MNLSSLLLAGALALPVVGSNVSIASSVSRDTAAPKTSAHPLADYPALQLSDAGSNVTVPSQAAPKKEPTPAELMRARFPQPVKVGDLIGLPVLDYDDRTIGYVQNVVKNKDGNIQLIVPYGKWFGWLRPDGWLGSGRRPVAVPIEVVAILARQIDALDMERKDFDRAPDFVASSAAPLAHDEIIQIAIAKR